MTEVWLQPNRRALTTTMTTFAVIGAAAGFAAWQFESWIIRSIAGVLAAVSVLMISAAAIELRRPRIAFRDGKVLFNLRGKEPAEVPVEIVEAFFLGQGPAHLPTIKSQPPECVNLVARLSEKAPEWVKVDVKPALGAWCEGYVTIRGTWCEPLGVEVIRRLNRRLREIREAGTP